MQEKVIQIAELENFIVYAKVKCYQFMDTSLPNYFIDTNTGENVGQNISLVIYPDGTYEPMHYKLFCAANGAVIDL